MIISRTHSCHWDNPNTCLLKRYVVLDYQKVTNDRYAWAWNQRRLKLAFLHIQKHFPLGQKFCSISSLYLIFRTTTSSLIQIKFGIGWGGHNFIIELWSKSLGFLIKCIFFGIYPKRWRTPFLWAHHLVFIIMVICCNQSSTMSTCLKALLF